MIDGKKVMEGLSNIRNEIVDGYINEPERAVNTLTDALELLKEQEQKINSLEEQLRLLEYGDQETQNSALMPAT